MEKGILRWQDVTKTVRKAAVRGLFGGNHRVSQLADGSWSLAPLETEAETLDGRARRVGNQLYAPQITVGGQPLQIGGVPNDADPAPFFDLTSLLAQTGWIIMVGEVEVIGGIVQPPMVATLSLGTMPTSTSTVARVPLALVKGRIVLSPSVRIES